MRALPDIPDLLLITRNVNASHKYDLVTSTFVGTANHSRPIHLNTYDGDQRTFEIQHVNMFSNKMLNLQGREFRISLMNYKPYCLWYLTVSSVIFYKVS